jgi:hypothetical protein
MPAGDGTGPSGMGPMTGRGAGYCAGYGAPGYANPMPGRGFGYAPAWGAPPIGAYGPYGAPPAPEQETEFLKTQAEWLKEQLDAISQRIAELEQEK